MTVITCTLRTVDASGQDVTRLVQIEPINDGSGEWRIVPETKRQHVQNRYNDKRMRNHATKIYR